MKNPLVAGYSCLILTLKFVNKFQYISIIFDLSIINNRDDIKHLLYELIKFSKDNK